MLHVWPFFFRQFGNSETRISEFSGQFHSERERYDP